MGARGVLAFMASSVVGVAGCGSLRRDLPARVPCDPEERTGCLVESLVFRGNAHLSEEALQAALVTAPTRRPLGGAFASVPVFGVWDRLSTSEEHFDPRAFERDLERVERLYRAHGYHEARVRGGRVLSRPDGRIQLEIAVDEGLPTWVRETHLTWLDGPPSREQGDIAHDVLAALRALRPGSPLVEAAYDGLKAEVLRVLQDRGHARARVQGEVRIDAWARLADVSLAITVGPVCRLGPVRVEGLRKVPESDVRAVLELDEGDLYTSSAFERARRALADLGVFGSIELEPLLSSEPPLGPCTVPVQVRVSEAALRAVRAGVGLELGARLEGHLLGAWEHRNLWGGLRHLSVELRPGLVLWPNYLGDLLLAPRKALPELRASAELRQPNTFERRTTGLLSGSFSLYCPLIHCSPQLFASRPEEGASVAEPNLVGYRELAGRAGLERPFGQGEVQLETSFDLRLYHPFSYNQPEVPGGYRAVRVQALRSKATLDLRRGAAGQASEASALEPRRGAFLATELQAAGGVFGGDADDLRVRPELRTYLPLSTHVVLAFRWAMGFLLPRNYADVFGSGSASLPARARDLQLLRLRGFFSGGQSSNRGYGFNQIGPNAPSTLVYPLARSSGSTLATAQDVIQVPVGGRSLWESSLELRFPLQGKLGAVVFLDASDVALERGRVRLDHPHPSWGVGARYETPVGPLRLDLGWRLPSVQVLGDGGTPPCARNCPAVVQDEASPANLWGLPIALAVAIGEAF